MIILSGGDDSRMREIIQNALTEAGEPFILTEDESDIISTEQAIAMIVYNANKVRTYLGRLERNTRKQEEELRKQEQDLEDIAKLLEPLAVFFEMRLGDDVPPSPRSNNVHSRLETIRAKRERDKRQREKERAAELPRESRGKAEEESS